ncbi:MAG: hypothetical protein LR011_03625 [Verrucomicrobia bacterium]|nr:hypothetical protein [Verrucomicrobiota bacterium]
MSKKNQSDKNSKSRKDPEPATPLGKDVSYSQIKFGWVSLLIFLTIGIILEALHGFKAQWYLNVANETRRLMLTLGHAHGTLLALVNLAYGVVCGMGFIRMTEKTHLTSQLLKISSILMPAGFLLGGIQIYGGDPGLGIILVPVSAMLLLVAVSLIVFSVKKPD